MLLLPHSLGEVKIEIDGTKPFSEGGLTVGGKRNALKSRVKTKYLCYLDDDEGISPDYVETLLRLCQSGADICTFQSLFTCDTYWSVIDMSLHYPTNEQATPEYTVRRKPWHVCPVRTELAQDINFPDKNNAEDWDWMDKVLVRCATQAKTNRIIHNYKHSASVSEVDKIERHGT